MATKQSIPDPTTGQNVSTPRSERSQAEKRAAACLSEITLLAGVLQDEIRWTVQDFENLEEDEIVRAASFVDRVRESVSKMGWLADLGAQVLGELPAKGDATQWLMSPVAAETMRQGGAA